MSQFERRTGASPGFRALLSGVKADPRNIGNSKPRRFFVVQGETSSEEVLSMSANSASASTTTGDFGVSSTPHYDDCA